MTTVPNNTAPTSGPVVVSDPAEIRRQVKSTLAGFAGAARDAQDANTAAKNESDKAIGTRERLLVQVAKVADAGRWSPDETGGVVSDILKTDYNGGKGALATFAGEIKTACSPRVRPQIERLFEMAHEIWDAETDAIASSDKPRDVPKPLRKEFARCYHMVVAAAKALGTAARDFDQPNDFVAWAQERARKRQLDFNKVKARLDAISKELTAFAKDFPVDGLTSCVEFIDSVTLGDLRACVETASEPAPAPEADDTPENSGDMLADVLGDMSAAA